MAGREKWKPRWSPPTANGTSVIPPKDGIGYLAAYLWFANHGVHSPDHLGKCLGRWLNDGLRAGRPFSCVFHCDTVVPWIDGAVSEGTWWLLYGRWMSKWLFAPRCSQNGFADIDRNQGMMDMMLRIGYENVLIIPTVHCSSAVSLTSSSPTAC